jgi:hypothetical protein
MYQNMWAIAESILREKPTALNYHIRKVEADDLKFHFKRKEK